MTEVEIITIDDDEETFRPTSRPRKRRISQSSALDSDDDIILESDWRRRRRIQPRLRSDVRTGRYYREREILRPRYHIGGEEDDIVVSPPPPPLRRQTRSPVPPPPPSDREMRRLRCDLSGGRDGETTRQRRAIYPQGNFGDQDIILLDNSPPSSPRPPPPPPHPSSPPPLHSSSRRRTIQAQLSSDLRRQRESNRITERGYRDHRGERVEVIF